MSPRSNIILWLAATAAVAAMTAWAVTQRVPLPDNSFRAGSAAAPLATEGGPVDTGHSESSLHDWMHRHLGISPEQHRRLDPLETAYETERVHLRQRIRQLGTDLAVAIRDGAPDGTVLEAQQALHEAQGRLQQATLRHFIEMKRHLTPEQAAKLAVWTHDSILHQPGN